MRIEKTVLGWMDLDHVLHVTPPAEPGDEGFWTIWEFQVFFMFRDKPLTVFASDEHIKEDTLLESERLRLQKEITAKHDAFVNQWRNEDGF